MEGVIYVRCPCCGAEFPYPKDHPIHNRLQLSLDLDFKEVQEIHNEVEGRFNALREGGAEVYDHSDEDDE